MPLRYALFLQTKAGVCPTQINEVVRGWGRYKETVDTNKGLQGENPFTQDPKGPSGQKRPLHGQTPLFSKVTPNSLLNNWGLAHWDTDPREAGYPGPLLKNRPPLKILWALSKLSCMMK